MLAAEIAAAAAAFVFVVVVVFAILMTLVVVVMVVQSLTNMTLVVAVVAELDLVQSLLLCQIWYQFLSTDHDHLYHPDLLLVEEDPLVEVEAYDIDDFPFVGVAAAVDVVRHTPVVHTCFLRHSFLVAIPQCLCYCQHLCDYQHH